MEAYNTRCELIKIFAELRKEGFVCMANHLCCGSCASYSIYSKIEERWKKNGKVPKGTFFWHHQDEEGFERASRKGTGGIHIRFGEGLSSEMEKANIKAPLFIVEVGQRFIEKLKEHKLSYEWDGTPERCIFVVIDGINPQPISKDQPDSDVKDPRAWGIPAEEIPAKKPKCKLTGIDGNVFNIIGTVSRELKRAGQHEKAKEFQTKAFTSESYDAVLSLCHDYVEVE
jgi:hypothetical protein